MNQMLSSLFYQPHNGYLKPEELSQFSQFVASLPERVNFYRRLRHEELALMQTVADALEQKFPQEPAAQLQRSLQSGILVLRYAAMAMLMDDPQFVTRRLDPWLPDISQGYDTGALDNALYLLMKQQFAARFSSEQMALLNPGLDAALALISPTADAVPVDAEALSSLF